MPCIETEKQVLGTIQSDIVCNQSRNVSRLTPRTHEEADTRIILHLEDAVTDGFNKISIRTVDTDVVVLAVTAAQRHGRSVYHMAIVNFDAIIPKFWSDFPNPICNFSFYFVFLKFLILFFMNIFWS